MYQSKAGSERGKEAEHLHEESGSKGKPERAEPVITLEHHQLQQIINLLTTISTNVLFTNTMLMDIHSKLIPVQHATEP